MIKILFDIRNHSRWPSNANWQKGLLLVILSDILMHSSLKLFVCKVQLPAVQLIFSNSKLIISLI